MKMKVIYILLVSLIWVHSAGAMVSGDEMKVSNRLIAANAPHLQVGVDTVAGKGHKKNEVTKAVSEGVSTQLIIYGLIIAFALAGLTLYLALKISGNRAEDQIADLLAKQKRDLKKNESNNSREGVATQNEVKALMERINDLENMVKILREKSETPVVPPPVAPLTKEVIPVEVPQPVVETRKEIFFLSTPNLNGSFNESSASATFREGASIYRFTKESFNKATFCIDEREASIKLALQYPDKSIDPVCEALNAYNARATKIVTKKPGTAELKGDKWVIQTKAKISYEG